MPKLHYQFSIIHCLTRHWSGIILLADIFKPAKSKIFVCDQNHQTKISFWKSLKINRISLGIQSLSDDTLKTLTRTHSSKLSKRSINLLKESDFPSFNLDVIFYSEC